MPKLLDANAILRYILADIEEQAELVHKAVAKGAETVPEVLCECVYVLQGRCYSFERKDISRALLAVLEDIGCERHAIMCSALELFSKSRLDFVDCILVAMSKDPSYEIITFDKELSNVIRNNA